MTDFRIIPARHEERAVHGKMRYALIIPGHPRGTDTGYEGPLPSREAAYRMTGQYFRKDDYVASWETLEEAKIAALNLGLDESDIHESFIALPSSDSKRGKWDD